MIIFHEVDPKSFVDRNWLNVGEFFKWFSTNTSFNDVGLRQFGVTQSSMLRNASVYLPKSVQKSSTVLVRNGQNLALLVQIMDDEKLSATKAEELRRPGVANNQTLFTTLGLRGKSQFSIFSIATSFGISSFSSYGEANDGWLKMPNSSKEKDAQLAEMFMLGICVAVERYILNESQQQISSRRLTMIRALQLLASVRSWPTLPSIDSTRLAHLYKKLRESLNLDLRRQEVLHALELKERNFTFTVASIGLFLGLLLSSYATFFK